QAIASLVAAKEWIAKNLPVFIYFDKYDILDSAINIVTFAQQLQSETHSPRTRVTRCLFEHVGLDLNEVIKLDPNKPGQAEEHLRKMADERAIRMSSASHAMTDKFSSWWEQRKHRFRYQVDGPYFRVWVSDDLDTSEIELDQ